MCYSGFHNNNPGNIPGCIIPVNRKGGYMHITLLRNNSEKNKLNKSLSDAITLTGTLKDETSIINPVVLMELSNPSNYNYAYIPEFNRYYFINDIVSVKNGLWRISLTVDVLESFKDSIMNVSAIISDTENIGLDKYMSGDVWKTKVKETTNIIKFPNGLSENGHFILITAGG